MNDAWETLYVFKRNFGKHELEAQGVDEDEYCDLGAGAAYLEMVIQGPEFHLERVLNQPFLG